MNTPRFTLHQNYENVDITHTFETPLLSEVLEQMEHFLRGCGFAFDGRLDIVNEETTPCGEESNQFYTNPTLDTSITQSDAQDVSYNTQFYESSEEERCDVCKIKKSVMKDYTCFDRHCTKDRW